MVLGHYYSTDTTALPDLNAYAIDLKAGGLVQAQYFARHTCSGSSAGFCKPSAIEIQPNVYCYPSPCPTHYMGSDRWQPNNMSDIGPLPLNYRYHAAWDVQQ